jgi:hypothetical protein
VESRSFHELTLLSRLLQKELAAGLVSESDLEKLLDLGKKNNVEFVIYHLLKQFYPDYESVERGGRLRQNWQKNLILLARLHEIIKFLDEHGIESLILKGPVSSMDIYGDLSIRQYSDLDILVMPQNKRKALNLAQQIGFQLKSDFTELQLKVFEGSNHAYTLVHPGWGIELDLHWEFCMPYLYFPLSVEEVFCQKRAISLLSKEVFTVSLFHSGVLLSFNLFKDIGLELKGLLDLIVFRQKYPVQFQGIEGWFQKNQMGLQYRFVKNLCDEFLNQSFERNCKIQFRAYQNGRFCFNILSKAFLQSRFHETFKQKIRLWMLFLFKLKPDDVFFNVPLGFGFLYYLVRLIRLLKSVFSLERIQ